MFEEVRICGLGSIDEAVLSLHPGLTVLSGETGAGKTSVVRAFGLLAGGRADASHIRSGRTAAAVEATFIVDPAGELAARVRDQGGDLDADRLLVARTLSADGRSRAFVGGRAVPLSALADLVGSVLALHGQSSQLQLRHPAAQREALDRYAGAGVLPVLASYRQAREQWMAARHARVTLVELEHERSGEAELLRLGLAEVERVAPVEGEDVALEQELSRLCAADELRTASETARALLSGSDASESDDPGAVGALALVARGLAAAAASDPELGVSAARAQELCMLAAELAADLASYAAQVDDDPRRLAERQERRAQLTQLCRPHATDVEGVLRWAADAQQRLADLECGEQRMSKLAAAEQSAATMMLEFAAQLSAARQTAARALQRDVTRELAALSMSAARLVAKVERGCGAVGDVATCQGHDQDASALAQRLGVDGGDEVELLFASGEGLALRPLARVASGGELSRVVLALEVVLAAGQGPATMVFDEVDAGIGGEAALEVGRRLAALAGSRQVICVTHLPQVAAFADRHLLAAKSGRAAAVHTRVDVLDLQERVRELSRMLAGVSDSELARGHAAELLASAAASAGRLTDLSPPLSPPKRPPGRRSLAPRDTRRGGAAQPVRRARAVL